MNKKPIILILFLILGSVLISGCTDSSDSSYSDSSSSSDSEIENVEYDPDTGIATATAECPYCGGTVGMASDGENTAIVCPDCGASYYS